jgi:hypothetical protein
MQPQGVGCWHDSSRASHRNSVPSSPSMWICKFQFLSFSGYFFSFRSGYKYATLTKAESYRNKIWKSTSLTYTGLEAISLWRTVNSIELQNTSSYLFVFTASYALAGGVSGLVPEYIKYQRINKFPMCYIIFPYLGISIRVGKFLVEPWNLAER